MRNPSPPRYPGIRRFALSAAFIGAMASPARGQPWLDPCEGQDITCKARLAQTQVALSTTTADLRDLSVRCQDALEVAWYVADERTDPEPAPVAEPLLDWPVALLGGIVAGLVAGLLLAN